jgi:hypothetical protein
VAVAAAAAAADEAAADIKTWTVLIPFSPSISFDWISGNPFLEQQQNGDALTTLVASRQNTNIMKLS